MPGCVPASASPSPTDLYVCFVVQGMFASLELLPMWSGVESDVELYASGVVVDDDGDFSGGQALNDGGLEAMVHGCKMPPGLWLVGVVGRQTATSRAARGPERQWVGGCSKECTGRWFLGSERQSPRGAPAMSRDRHRQPLLLSPLALLCSSHATPTNSPQMLRAPAALVVAAPAAAARAAAARAARLPLSPLACACTSRRSRSG